MAMRFLDLVERIYAKSPLQKKRLSAYLAGRTPAFFQEADKFAVRYGDFLVTRGISIDYAVDAYLKMCGNMLRCQMDFMRTGRYPVESSDQANQAVYSSDSEMLSYMVGLGISQFLWSTHYEMFSFFSAAIHERSSLISSYLEIGPGHGLLLEKALTLGNKLTEAVAVDISPTSLGLAQAIVAHSMPDKNIVRFVLGDILKTDLGRQFDFITMGEVLEHVNQPNTLLIRLKQMLAPEGHGFISTCANCPAIDHVYQFDTVDQIRAMITSSGLIIEKDLPLSVEDMSVSEAEKKRITINYCALVR
jgi:2-polyprenyl-3-methyl-5-hydroxy-6-metoxy-1,4-benzoquinol methylase